MSIRLHPIRHCFWCGEELGRYSDYDPLDNCGGVACRREAQSQEAELRQRDQTLDDDMDWR